MKTSISTSTLIQWRNGLLLRLSDFFDCVLLFEAPRRKVSSFLSPCNSTRRSRARLQRRPCAITVFPHSNNKLLIIIFDEKNARCAPPPPPPVSLTCSIVAIDSVRGERVQCTFAIRAQTENESASPFEELIILEEMRRWWWWWCWLDAATSVVVAATACRARAPVVCLPLVKHENSTTV